MRLHLRETGSIVVDAPKEDVLLALERASLGARVSADRVESQGSAYVVRESTAGTHVFHVREERAPVARAGRERDELRRSLKADLYELRRMFDAR